MTTTDDRPTEQATEEHDSVEKALGAQIRADEEERRIVASRVAQSELPHSIIVAIDAVPRARHFFDKGLWRTAASELQQAGHCEQAGWLRLKAPYLCDR